MAARPPASGVLAGAGADRGLVDLDQAGQGIAPGRGHCAAQLRRQQPGRLVGAEVELHLELRRRDAVGMGRHQMGGPEPDGERELGAVQDRARLHRGLSSATATLEGPGFRAQGPGVVVAAGGAEKPIGPAQFGQPGGAGGFVGKVALEFDQRRGEFGHGGGSQGAYSLFVRTHRRADVINILGNRSCRDRPLHPKVYPLAVCRT